MPKSKREQKVTLSKTIKKGRARKETILNEVRECVDRFANAYVFSAATMRNSALKDVRAKLKESRLYFGRNKLIAASLGRSPSDEYADGLSDVANRMLGGEHGVIFSDLDAASIRKCFDESQVPEFARAGFAATRVVTLDHGPLDFPHSMEPYLRKLGLPTRLMSGTVTLLSDHRICREGEELSAEQAKLLQLLDIKMAVFKLTLVCRWTKGGDFEDFGE
mmetsp:Transcript_55389/g.127314  ORF Transcript_55389/g.127314 Transcript_55389/m.127314 type:complete len:220 (-) Transcript_55389:382-1041(-)